MMPELGPQTYSTGQRLHRSHRRPRRPRRAPRRRSASIERAEARASGRRRVRRRLSRGERRRAARSRRAKGLFAYHASTDAISRRPCARPTAPDRAGHGGARDWSASIPPRSAASPRRRRSRRRNPTAIEPGLYTVVLEPQAVADSFRCSSARSTRARPTKDAARSQAGGGTKLGEKIADERVTIYSDPTDPDLLAQPFDGEGLPLERRVWIENGILKNFSYSTLLGAEAGQGSRPAAAAEVAAAVVAVRRRWRGGLKMVGGTKSTRRAHRRHAARHSRHALLLHPLPRSAHGAAHRPHARRHVPHRERQDHAGAQELPLEREPAVHAEQDRGDRARRADGGGPGDAGACA